MQNLDYIKDLGALTIIHIVVLNIVGFKVIE